MAPNPFIGAGYESFWLGPRLETMWSTFPGLYLNEAHNVTSRLTSTWDGWGGADRANFDSRLSPGRPRLSLRSHLWRTALSLRPHGSGLQHYRGRIQVAGLDMDVLLLAIIAANGAAADPKSGLAAFNAFDRTPIGLKS